MVIVLGGTISPIKDISGTGGGLTIIANKSRHCIIISSMNMWSMINLMIWITPLHIPPKISVTHKCKGLIRTLHKPFNSESPAHTFNPTLSPSKYRGYPVKWNPPLKETLQSIAIGSSPRFTKVFHTLPSIGLYFFQYLQVTIFPKTQRRK